MDIRLVLEDDPNTSFIALAESIVNNVEVIDVTIPVSGTYKIQTRLLDSDFEWRESPPRLNYWVVWRAY